MNLRNEKGFTLIEIVMVIILLGILAAVAIPRFLDLTGKAKEGATRGILGGVRGAISIAYANNALHLHAGWPGIGNLRGSMTQGIPANPYNTYTGVQAPGSPGANMGWVYDASSGKFYTVSNHGVGANKW